MFATYVGHIIWYTSCCFHYHKKTLKIVLYSRSVVLSSLTWYFLKLILDQFRDDAGLEKDKYFTVFDCLLIAVLAIAIKIFVNRLRVQYEDNLL